MVRLAIIGTAHVQIRADDKYFESDIRAATKKIKNVVIQLKADVDLSKASKKIRDLRYRITSKDAVLTVDANVAKAEAKMEALLKKFVDKDVSVTANANTTGAIAQLTALSSTFAGTTATINANADTTTANSQLALAARPRVALIKTLVDPETSKALKGIFHTITGTLDGAKIKSVLSGIAANFEGIAFKATALVTALSAVSAMALNAGASILSISGDITQIIGLTALIPAAIGTMVSIMVANKMAWKGFGEAFDKDAKKAAAALAKLPPEAQKAVKALRGVYTEIQKPVQNAFWKEMGTSLQDTVRTLLPQLKTGLSNIGQGWAMVISEALLGFKRLGENKGMEIMLNNVAGMLTALSVGMGPLIDAFNTLGLVGSSYLPEFGVWLSDLAIQFKAFIVEAEKTGKINEWIETGTQRLQEMGSIIKSTTGIFGGLTDAARMAGAPGLTEMANGLRDVRDTVNSEPFQSRLTTVLSGARDGADAMGESFGKLSKFVGESSGSIRIFLEESGKVAANVFTTIKTMFDGTGLGAGLMSAMHGLGDALKVMQPGFADLGSAIGHLGEIAGEVFRGIAPGLNMVFDTVDQSIGAMKKGILDALPVFNTFIQGIMAVVQGPIVALATGIGNALTAFSQLPGVLQTVVMSIGLFLLLRGPLMKMFGGFGQMVARETSLATSSLNNVINGAKQMRGGVTDAFSTMGASIKNTMTATSQGFGKIFSPLIGHVQEAKTVLATAAQQIGAGFKQGIAIGPYLDTVKKGFTDLRTSVGQTTTGMVSEMRGKISDLGKVIAPAGGFLNTAGTKIREQASQMHNHLAPARAAFAALPTAALEAGKLAATNIGAGFKSIGAGLLGAMGGGWGLALAGATIALGVFAAEQGKAKAKVDAMVDSLDRQTGAMTDASKTLVAKELMDFDATGLDDFIRSMTGMGSKSGEILEELGLNTEDVTKKLSDPSGRDDYLKNWAAISANIHGNQKDFDTLGEAVGTTGDQLRSLSGHEIAEIEKRVKIAAETAAKAEKKFQDLANATGKTTVQAAMLSKNFDTLKSSTSSVSEKFSALKQNIDIASDGMISARSNALNMATSIFDLKDGIDGIGGKYDGWVEGQTKFSDKFKSTLLDVNGQFDVTSRGAVAFGKQMEGARDSVLQSGAAELKRLQDTGMLFPEAAAGALEVMRKGGDQVRQTMLDAGLDVGTVNTIMSNLKLNPEDLQGAIMIDTKDAEAKIMKLELMKSAVMSGNWEVALTASSEQVQNTILGTDRMREAYKNGGWEAVAKLKDDTGKGMGEVMAKLALAKDEAEINAILRASFPGSDVFDEANRKATEYGLKDVKATLGVEDNATIPASIALDGLKRSYGEKEIKAALGIKDDATIPASIARAGILREFSEGGPITAQIKAIDATMPARESALVNMDIPDAEAFLFGVDGTAPATEQAQVTMGGLQDITRFLFSEDKAKAGLDAATGTMNTLQNVSRWLQAINQAGDGKNAAQATIDLLKGKEVRLSADDEASGVVDNVNNKSLNNKSFNIIGVLSGVSQAVRDMLGMAHGGIMHNNVQTFATGGILKNAAAPAVKAFANGGIENHVAQIAYKSAAVPMRIWAEAEGGEAYIPLDKRKRKRSLEILRQVMDEFGLGQFAMFADGGFNNKQTPSIVSSRYTTASPVSESGTSSVSSAGTNIQLTVNPSQGLSEEQIGEAAMKELYWQLASR